MVLATPTAEQQYPQELLLQIDSARNFDNCRQDHHQPGNIPHHYKKLFCHPRARRYDHNSHTSHQTKH